MDLAIDQYLLPSTAAIPNSPYPLLHCRNFPFNPEKTASQFFNLLASNGWHTQWVFRYGQTQRAHYHSAVHECMVVLTGTATIRFGVADTVEDMHENTYGRGKEDGGIELRASPGDVFIIPAGVAHKTFNTQPAAEFKRISSGDGHGIPRDAHVDNFELSGFTMMGAYPVDGQPWDFIVKADGPNTFDEVRSVLPPKTDPLFGYSEKGLLSLWRTSDSVIPAAANEGH